MTSSLRSILWVLPFTVFAISGLAPTASGGAAGAHRGTAVPGPLGGPENTAYRIEGEAVQLIDGHNERPAAPGSASKIATGILGNPAAGDLDGNGRPDVALTLFQQTGGTGTFVYVAAAIRHASGFRGTNAVFIGDRIVVDRISIRSEVIVVAYRDRNAGEPMAADPSVARTLHCIVDNGELKKIEPPRGPDRLFEGWVNTGHEVRIFRSCGQTEDWWLVGNGSAYEEVVGAHREHTTGEKPYTPVFMVLYGHRVESPKRGFAADYPKGFFASRLLRVSANASCQSALILVESPTSGSKIESPLAVIGWARGSWFFEGDFPMLLVDDNGNELGHGFCTAQGPWMTQDFVAFKGTLSFSTPAVATRGFLLLQKDNPTGKREQDNVLKIPLAVQ
jgi:hypothetical protein